MRKLIVLLLTSVLATGAVANADQVTVVKNPNEFIKIGGIFERNNSTLLAQGIVPVPQVNSPKIYKLHVDVANKLGEDDLVQVAVCLYDSAIITDPNNTNCGDGNTNPAVTGAEFPSSGWQGQVIPESAIQMAFMPIRYSFAGRQSVGLAKPLGGPPTYHVVNRELNPGETNEFVSRITRVGALGSDTAVEDGGVWALEFAFGLSTAAYHADTWKIRVLASYEGDNNLELIGEDSYTVSYFGGFKSLTERGRSAVVNYGDVVSGGEAVKEEITTGEYYTNFYSNITLEASLFKATADDNNVLAFSGNRDPQAGEVSLECGETGQSKTLFGPLANSPTNGKTSKNLLSVIPASKIPEVTDPSAAVQAPTHDCTFYAGTGITTGQYSNDITIGLSKGPAPVG